jgi:sigma-B regulation protein RsbU (phosphoserine phosphatase)
MSNIPYPPPIGEHLSSPKHRRRLNRWFNMHILALLCFILLVMNVFDFVILSKKADFDTIYDILMQSILFIPLLLLYKRQGEYAAKLEDSEQRYQSLYQCQTMGIYVVNQDGTINSVSPSLLDLLGYSEEELKDKQFMTFIAPDELPLIQNAFKETISGNNVDSLIKITLPHKKGERRTFETMGVPLRVKGEIHGIIGIAKDITEFERMQEKLNYMQTQMNNIFKSIDIVLWSLDVATNKLITISPACEKIYGFPPEVFYQYPHLWSEVIHPEDKAMEEKDLAILLTTDAVYTCSEYRIFHANGGIRWAESRMFSEQNAEGEMIGIKGVVIDITHKKTNEANLQKDLNLARLVQESVLSQPLQTASISIDARYIPSQQLGGDMYAWYRLDEHRYGVMLMDVMGHGVSSSLICMSIRSLLEGIIRNCVDPEIVIKELNKHMFKLFRQTDALTSFFFTVIYIIVDTEKNSIDYINAGHTTALLTNSNGEIREMESTCIPLGLMPDMEPEKRTIYYEGPTRLILYTDGLIEAAGSLQQERIDLVKGVLQESTKEPMHQLMDKLITLSKANNLENSDDVCLICLDM